MNEQRLVELEERLTFQEATIQQLNDVVVEQQNAIDLLKMQIASLRSAMETFKDACGSTIPDEKPPHY